MMGFGPYKGRAAEMGRKLPGQGREVGFSLCKDAAGHIVKGPTAVGTANRVSIPIRCPHGSRFYGFYHTHPGSGSSVQPSEMDIASARSSGAKVTCIETDSRMQCYRIIPG